MYREPPDPNDLDDGGEADPGQPALPACLGVVGLGLVGASLARSFRAASSRGRIVAVETDAAVRSAAEVDGVANVVVGEPGPELAACNIVVLCTPLAAVLALLGPVSAHMKNGAVLSDVAGVKEPLLAAARVEVRGPVTFVGAHPMFGGTEGGYAAARADRWRGGTVAVCSNGDGPGAGRQAVRRVVGLHRALGARVVVCTAAEHDEAVAFTSHLPYLASCALVLALEDAPPLARRLRGPGIRDATRLAAFEYAVQGEVARRSGALADATSRFTEHLSRLSAALADGADPDAARSLLDAARSARRGWTE